MRIDIIAAGRLKKGPLFELSQEYIKRLRWPVHIHEIESRYKDSAEMTADEHAKIGVLLKSDRYIIALDERGTSLRSLDFAKKLEVLQNAGRADIQFVVGGAEGIGEALRARAHFVMGLGVQTWPHMLARIMLLEQIYRAQQILGGHPYHRE